MVVVGGHARGVPGSVCKQPCSMLQLIGSRVGASKWLHL